MVATLFMSSNKSQMFDEKIEGIEREREHMCEIWTRYCNDLRGLEEHCITKHTRHDDDEMNLRKNRVTLQKWLIELAMIAKLRSH